MQSIFRTEPTGRQVKGTYCLYHAGPITWSDNKARELNCPTTKPPTDFTASRKLINIT